MIKREILTGIVKWFNADRGYGFIATAEHGDIFVHMRALTEGRTALTIGEQVYFQLRQTPKGLEAADVHVGVPPPPPQPALPTLELATPSVSAWVKMRVVGRLGEVHSLGRPQQPPSLFAFVMQIGGEQARTLSVGPSPIAATRCLVLISFRHWARVEIMKAEQQDDQQQELIIDGHAALDPRLPGMIVLRATSVTTPAREQARRTAQALARARAAAARAVNTAAAES